MALRIDFLSLAAAAALAALSAAPSRAAEDAPTPPKERWSFAGPFGQYNRAQLQRGFKVFIDLWSAVQ